MRLGSRIKPRGATATRWARWHDWNRKVVQNRAKFQCEGCGARIRPLEWAHLVGRNNKGIGEPWCSLPELTAGLCVSAYGVTGCHDQIDRGLAPALLKILRTDALIRLCARFELGLTEIIGTYGDPLDAIREAVRRLEIDGWVYDVDRNQVVKP